MSIYDELSKQIAAELPSDPHLRLVAWHDIAELLKKVKAVESKLRGELVTTFFPAPVEGTNTVDLGNDWQVKLVGKVARKCDEAAFAAVFEQLPRGAKQKLIKFKPDLILKEYKKLPPDQRLIFDQALIIKPGSPTLSLIPPKDA